MVDTALLLCYCIRVGQQRKRVCKWLRRHVNRTERIVMLKIAGGIILAVAVIGIFNAAVDRYEFERRCIITEKYLEEYNWRCDSRAWFSFKD